MAFFGMKLHSGNVVFLHRAGKIFSIKAGSNALIVILHIGMIGMHKIIAGNLIINLE